MSDLFSDLTDIQIDLKSTANSAISASVIDLIDNGDFSSGSTSWSTSGPISITAGIGATATSSGASISQTLSSSLVANNRYLLKIYITPASSYGQFSYSINLGGTVKNGSIILNGSTEISEHITVPDSDSLSANLFSISSMFYLNLVFPLADDFTISKIELFEVDMGRTQSWDIVLDMVPIGVYGYGYGNTLKYVNPQFATAGDIDYFNVFGISGEKTGYGIAGTDTNIFIDPPLNTMEYGWGYEFSSVYLSGSSHTATVRALVTENNIPQEGIRVIFLGSPNISLNPNAAITDSNGYAYTTVAMDMSGERNMSTDGFSFKEISVPGFMTIRAEIDKLPENTVDKTNVIIESTQIFSEDALIQLSFSSYAFQPRYGYSYGYVGSGYGYSVRGMLI